MWMILEVRRRRGPGIVGFRGLILRAMRPEIKWLLPQPANTWRMMQLGLRWEETARARSQLGLLLVLLLVVVAQMVVGLLLLGMVMVGMAQVMAHQ